MIKEIFSEHHQVTLREINAQNLIEILKLEVKDYQKRFVAPNSVSIAQAHFEENAWYRGIYRNDTPVGFVMLDLNIEKSDYFLWRLMIDQNYQGMGYGKEALELIVQYVLEQPNAQKLVVSCIPAEDGPLEFYKTFGFDSTETFVQDELILELSLDQFVEATDTNSAGMIPDHEHEPHNSGISELEWEEVDVELTSTLKHDLDLWGLYDQLNWNGYLKLNAEELNQAMLQSYKVIYVYANEQLIGTGRLISDGMTNAYLCGVGVLEAYRNQGIGSLISKELSSVARTNGLTIQLLCEDHLVTYYERLGFTTFAVGMKINKKN